MTSVDTSPIRPHRTPPDPIDRHVGMRIRQRRVGLRLSQTRLGEAIGVTFQQIQKYENGTNRIGASNLFKLASTLDVDVSYLFAGLDSDGESVNPPPAPADGSPQGRETDPLSSREGIELVHNFVAIRDEDVRRKLSIFVRTLAEAEGERT